WRSRWPQANRRCPREPTRELPSRSRAILRRSVKMPQSLIVALALSCIGQVSPPALQEQWREQSSVPCVATQSLPAPAPPAQAVPDKPGELSVTMVLTDSQPDSQNNAKRKDRSVRERPDDERDAMRESAKAWRDASKALAGAGI